jgi:hypothetical protein
MATHSRFHTIAAMLLILASVPPGPPASASAPTVQNGTCRAFKETGKSVCGRFLQYWLDHGALVQQGFPISDELRQKSDLDGKIYTVQYFERAVFELHPENVAPYDVLLSLLGTLLYTQKYPQGAPAQTQDNTPSSQLFDATGRRVGGKFLHYWTTHGGLAQLGYPISDQFQERSDLDGKTYTVQYFERAVLELHPENQPPYDVLQSQLGTFRFRQNRSNLAAVHNINMVFVVMMENTDWSQIKGSSSAPYINNVLLPMASHAEQYYNPPGVHPSEPNYLWLEAGTDFGITDDNNPDANHQSDNRHLVKLLSDNGITWESYQEGISGKDCPLQEAGLYAPKHNPMVFFDDVTAHNSSDSAYCIAHVRPYNELAKDLQTGQVPRYNFITPNLCHDMHNPYGCDTADTIKNGDTWLSQELPKILTSQAYKTGGAIFLTWDEGSGDGPIGMIVLSPFAKGNAYSNALHYTHSSTLRTIQEIFAVTPLLGDAPAARDLSDLFKVFP